MKKVKLIYNPFSGGGKILENLDDIFEVYQSHGYIVDIFRISFNCEYETLLNNIEEYDHFLISGGDGTVNQVVNIIKKANKNIPVGILPGGTANDFAAFLKMPLDLKEAAKRIIHSKVQDLDIGKINDQYFINVASAGIFSDISQNTSLTWKKRLGKIAYYLKGIEEIAKVKKIKMSIKADEFEIEEEVIAVLVFNGKSAGLIELARKSEINDGFLHVLLIKPGNILDIINILKNMILNNELHEGVNGINHFKTSSLKLEILEGHDLISDLDGERGPKFPLDINCLKGEFKVLGASIKNLKYIEKN